MEQMGCHLKSEMLGRWSQSRLKLAIGAINANPSKAYAAPRKSMDYLFVFLVTEDSILNSLFYFQVYVDLCNGFNRYVEL